MAQRFVSEMIYGIQASQSVMLTKIARVLEENISLKKTHERLSRNLGMYELEKTLLQNLLSLAKKHVGKDTLLVLDPSDLSKKYAEKMEHLCRVRDGKEKLKLLVGHVFSAAKRIFEIPDFKYYSISDGLKKLFDQHPGRPRRPRKKPPDPQLLLFDT